MRPIAFRRSGLLTSAVAAVALLWAAPASAESLEEALASAYEGNPSLLAGRAELRGVNEQVPQAQSGWRPTVTVTGQAGHRDTDIDVDGFPDPRDPDEDFVGGQLSITQPLYRGGRTIAQTEQAEANVQAQRASLAAVEQDVLLRAVTAYMNVWQAQAVLRLNENNEQVLTRQLEASQDRFNVGEITLTDVAQSESRLALATANRIRAEGDLSIARADYEEVIGHPPSGVEPPQEVGGIPPNLTAAIENARSFNPNIVAADYAERAARALVDFRIGELLPTVELTGSASIEHAESRPDRTTETLEVFAGVSIPLYQQGAEYSRVREAKQVASQRLLELDQARRTAEEDTVTAWEALQTALAQIVSFQAQVDSAEVALEGVRLENSVGSRTVLDILDAEQELVDAQVNLVGAQRDRIVAAYQLLAAMGDLNARSLGLPVNFYDVEVDYNAVDGAWIGLTAPGVEE